MNRQVNYIIYAILLSLSLPIGYYFIDKIVTAETIKQNQSVIIDESSESRTIPVNKSAYLGKSLFNRKCASCHQIYRHAVGPALLGLEERGPWEERRNLYAWIKNPVAFMKTNKYTQELKSSYGTMMQSFPDITNEEVDAIVDYINAQAEIRQVPAQ